MKQRSNIAWPVGIFKDTFWFHLIKISFQNFVILQRYYVSLSVLLMVTHVWCFCFIDGLLFKLANLTHLHGDTSKVSGFNRIFVDYFCEYICLIWLMGFYQPQGFREYLRTVYKHDTKLDMCPKSSYFRCVMDIHGLESKYYLQNALLQTNK